MWVWIIGFFVACAVMSVVIARRGPGSGADYDDARRQDPYSGGHFPGGGLGGDGGAGT